MKKNLGGGSATRPLPTDGAAEEFCGDPTVRPCPKRSGLEIKHGSSAKEGALERLRCGIIQKVS